MFNVYFNFHLVYLGGWVEGIVEDDGEMTGDNIEHAEDISNNSAFGPVTPSSPTNPMTISQSHKKS